MNEDVDIVTARAVALLPPSSRQRLDTELRHRTRHSTGAMKTYTAAEGEIDGISLEVDSKRGKLVTTVRLSTDVRWERHALHVTMPWPDTILSALRNKRLDAVVDHPLLQGIKITSARRQGDTVIIETARQPLAAIADIVSSGMDRPLDLIETLRTLGVVESCKVAADLVRNIPVSNRHLLATRLTASTSRSSRVSDIIGWKPTGATAVSLLVKDGRLQAYVQFSVGCFNQGHLAIHGSSRTNGRLLTGAFARFKARRSNDYRSRLERPTITLDQLAEHIRPSTLAMAA